MRSRTKILLVILLLCILGLGLLIVIPTFLGRKSRPGRLDTLHTVAGTAGIYQAQPFGEVFGIAVSPKGNIYFSDGEKGIVWQLDWEGKATPLTEHLATPSGIALAPDGSLIVADSGAHTILKIELPSGQVSVLAGVPQQSGLADGDA
ncbi:MAG: hypothetical protein ABIP75_11020, partial [Pyrinomonadaceae bacterium]